MSLFIPSRFNDAKPSIRVLFSTKPRLNEGTTDKVIQKKKLGTIKELKYGGIDR